MTKRDWATVWVIFYELIWPRCFSTKSVGCFKLIVFTAPHQQQQQLWKRNPLFTLGSAENNDKISCFESQNPFAIHPTWRNLKPLFHCIIPFGLLQRDLGSI
jgi:hypothetical protein